MKERILAVLLLVGMGHGFICGIAQAAEVSGVVYLKSRTTGAAVRVFDEAVVFCPLTPAVRAALIQAAGCADHLPPERPPEVRKALKECQGFGCHRGDPVRARAVLECADKVRAVIADHGQRTATDIEGRYRIDVPRGDYLVWSMALGGLHWAEIVEVSGRPVTLDLSPSKALGTAGFLTAVRSRVKAH